MCKLYIETSDLDNAIEAAIASQPLTGLAILDLHSEKLTKFAQERAAGAEYVDIEQHTKFSVVTGIIIGLKLAESQLNLDVGVVEAPDVSEYDSLDNDFVVDYAQ